MKFLKFITAAILLTLTASAFAQGVPEGNPVESLLALIKDYKAMSPFAIGMASIAVIVQLLKAEFFGAFFDKFKYKRLLIAALGQAYGILFLLASGSSVVDAFIVGFVSSGGAVALYEAYKGAKK